MGKKIPPQRPCNWAVFGQFIFTQREADPGYYVLAYLREAKFPTSQLYRFAVAWCAFYNLGIAARASELQGADFYKLLRDLYPTATRASERRHFRGQAGLTALAQWERNWPQPEQLAEYIVGNPKTDPVHMDYIRKACGQVMQMGDYFKWKWGDLKEVLRQEPCDFHGFENVSPKVPQQGAALIATEAGKTGWDTRMVYESITKKMQALGVRSYYAPWREFDVQDAETICCVYKQYRSGSYHPGIRTAKAFARLRNDGDGCKTAKRAIAELLGNQPQPLFQEPKVLARVLAGEQIFTVEELM